MKYRIYFDGDHYYPEKKFRYWPFWSTFKDRLGCTCYYGELDYAYKFLDKEIEKRSISPKIYLYPKEKSKTKKVRKWDIMKK